MLMRQSCQNDAVARLAPLGNELFKGPPRRLLQCEGRRRRPTLDAQGFGAFQRLPNVLFRQIEAVGFRRTRALAEPQARVIGFGHMPANAFEPILDAHVGQDHRLYEEIKQGRGGLSIDRRARVLMIGLIILGRPVAPLSRRGQTDRLDLGAPALRHGIEGVDLDDPVCLVQSDAIRRGGRGREDVDHRAKQSVLARFIDPLIRRIARIFQKRLQGFAIQRFARRERQAGLDPFARRRPLHDRIGRGDQEHRPYAGFVQGGQDGHPPPHAFSRRRGAVVRQAVPRRQDQHLGVFHHR